jgi:hypothetical protein
VPHTPRLRRVALLLFATFSASLLATAFAASPASAAPPTYVVSGDSDGQTGNEWALNGTYSSDLRALITNSANFGASGTVRAIFTIAAPRVYPLGPSSLNGIDVYYLAARNLVQSDYDALQAFVRRGGALIVNSNAPGFYDTTSWPALGLTLSPRVVYGDRAGSTTHRAPTPSAIVGAQANHPVLTGPFGTVGSFDNWHSVAGFTATPSNATVLARTTLTGAPDDLDPPGGPDITITDVATLAAYPTNTLFGPGSGPVIATSDVDTFSNAYSVAGTGFATGLDTTCRLGTVASGLTGNGTLAANVFAWIAAQKMAQSGITSGYVSLTSPVRALDTRATSALGPNEIRNLSLAGAGVPLDATMVAVNVTAVDPTANGYLTVWPQGGGVPGVSSVNFVAGTTVANAAFVKLGANATISIFNLTGATHVLVDVIGYVASSGSRLVNVGPTRIKDTRVNLGGFGRAGAGQTQTLQVAGTGGVPNGATGVILNVTAVDPTATAYVTAWPADQTQPTVSNINTVAGTTVPNLVVVRLPTSGASAGKINLYNAAGDTQLLVDVLGYFTNAAPAGSITPETPHRQLDTRPSNTPLTPGETRRIDTGLTGATAIIVNVTAVDPTATGYLTVFPADGTQPNASNVNFYAGRNAPNLVVVHPDASGAIKVFNSAGNTQLLVDVIGRFDG